jgi:hypothetical protein
MTKSQSLLKLLEAALDPEVQKVIDQLDAAIKKTTGAEAYRQSETGNQSGKLYRIIQDKNWANGAPVAMFRVPIITVEKGRSTNDATYDAKNSNQNFKKAFDPFWKLRDEGWVLSQPVGGQKEGDGWENKDEQTSGTILQFVIGKAPVAQ